MEIISQALSKPHADEAAQLSIARDYIQMYGEIGAKNHTMIFNDRPADIHALIAQAGSVLKVTPPGLTNQEIPKKK
jgi:hypothetical protein